MMYTEDHSGRLRKPVLAFLLAVGCLQMAGDIAGLPAVRAFGLALHASPAPKVFTAQEGFETYSSNFYLDWTDVQDKKHSLHITPHIYYDGVKGPYNRRNAYGAALSYGPVLSKNPKTLPMFEDVARFSLCGRAPMLRELGIDPLTVKGPVTIRLVPRQNLPKDNTWKLAYEIACP